MTAIDDARAEAARVRAKIATALRSGDKAALAALLRGLTNRASDVAARLPGGGTVTTGGIRDLVAEVLRACPEVSADEVNAALAKWETTLKDASPSIIANGPLVIPRLNRDRPRASPERGSISPKAVDHDDLPQPSKAPSAKSTSPSLSVPAGSLPDTGLGTSSSNLVSATSGRQERAALTPRISGSGAETPATMVSVAVPVGTRKFSGLQTETKSPDPAEAAVCVEVILRREAMQHFVACGIGTVFRNSICSALLADARRVAVEGPFPPAWNSLRISLLPSSLPHSHKRRVLDPGFDPRTAAELAGELFRLLSHRDGPLSSALGAVRAVLIDDPTNSSGAPSVSTTPNSDPKKSHPPTKFDGQHNLPLQTNSSSSALVSTGRASGLAAQLVYSLARQPPPLPPPPSSQDRHMSRRRAEVRSRWRRLARRQADAAAAITGRDRTIVAVAAAAADRGGDVWKQYESRNHGRPFWHNWVTGEYSWVPPQ